MLGTAIRAESAQQGVSQVNGNVDVMCFFQENILTELQESNMSVRPMVKATAIKFVSTFRNQFSKDHVKSLMPLLIAHLSADSVVVHTYAAAAIEKILTSKEDGPSGKKQNRFVGADIQPFLESLFTGLFGIVDKQDLNENEYVMKCVMRTLNTSKDDIMQVTQIVLDKLTSALGRVAKNPRNPHYNHYLFESIAVLVRAVCSKDPSHTASFENLLFPPFQTVLQMDVAEFTPYVFQVLAQLLEYRPADAGLGDAYTGLFAPLLTPTLWERRGNVPALTRLIQAYLGKGAAEIAANNHLVGILGVFQKLVASRGTEVSAFELLGSIIQCVPPEAIQPCLKDLFQILLMKLQQSKTPRYVRLISDFFALFVGKFGSQAYFDQLNAIQPGLGLMLLTQVWVPRLSTDLPVRMDAKTQVVGLTKILCDTPALLTDDNTKQVWAGAFFGAMTIITNPDSHIGTAFASGDDVDDAEIGYDATYSRLHFATRPVIDPFPEVQDPAIALAQSLGQLSASQPGKIQPLVQTGLRDDPKLSSKLAELQTRANVQI